MKKKRTTISNISVSGYELTNAQFQRVTGGAAPTTKCWQASSSMTTPGHSDPAQDYVVD